MRLASWVTRAALLCAGSVGMYGCGDDGGGGSGSDADSTAPESTAEEAGSGDGAEVGTEETETGEPFVPIVARGIQISRVTVNQGTEIPISLDGEWVDGGGRNAPIAPNRDTLLMIEWTLEEGFEPRDIEARLTLNFPDGTTFEDSETKPVEGESAPGNFDRSFFFGILAEQAIPGTTYSVELWEAAPGQEDTPEPAMPPRVPASGSDIIGFEADPMVMRIVVVPFQSNWATCQALPNLDEAQMASFEQRMLQGEPVERIEMSISEPPIVVNSQPSSFSTFFSDLAQRRVEDGADPSVYYYGAMNACAGDVGGAGGQAPLLFEASMADASSRVSMGLVLNNSDNFNTTTMLHEIGHNQGLQHVFCPDADPPAAGPDPTYPYADGSIGVYGFGIADFTMRSPSASHDYMSYCYGKSWPSDWTWNKVYSRIRTLTSWDEGGAPAPRPDEWLLYGVRTVAGEERWWTAPGAFRADVVTDHVVYGRGDGDEQVVPARQIPLSHGEDQMWVAPLPADFAEVSTVKHLRGHGTVTIDRNAVVEPVWGARRSTP